MSAQISEQNEENIFTKFGYFLSTSTPIVENILKYMEPSELSKNAVVCSLWASVARTIKAHNPPKSIRFFAIRAMPDKKSYAQHASYLEVGDKFYDAMRSTFHPPKVAIFFGSKLVLNKPENYFSLATSKRKRAEKDVPTDPPDGAANSSVVNPESEAYFYTQVGMLLSPGFLHMVQRLPGTCASVFLETYGLLGTGHDPEMTPLEFAFADGCSGLFLPNFPDLKFYPFSVPVMHIAASLIRKANGDVSLITGIPPDENLKALIVIQKSNYSGLQSVLDYYMARSEKNFAFAGAVVNSVRTFNWHPKNSHSAADPWNPPALGLAITGSGVRAASILMDPDVKDDELIESALTPLKDFHYDPDCSCVALFFACCARAEAFHQKICAEATVFRRMFPKIPIHGLYGNGEFGANFIPPWHGSDGNSFEGINLRPSLSSREFPYGYCTAVMMIAFKPTSGKTSGTTSSPNASPSSASNSNSDKSPSP